MSSPHIAAPCSSACRCCSARASPARAADRPRAKRRGTAQSNPVRDPGAGARRLHVDRLGLRQPAGFGAVGGDEAATLWIRTATGELKNLTQSAGYGVSGLQGASSIAVREPSVHWSGTKALFSMVVGGATQAMRSRPVLLPDLRDHGTRAERYAGHHEGAESAGQLQQRQPDLRHRRADHLHLRSAAQRRSCAVPRNAMSAKKRRPSPACEPEPVDGRSVR